MGLRKPFAGTFFSVRIFGSVLGLIVYIVFSLLGSFTRISERLETRILDLNFVLKQSLFRENIQQNVVTEQRSKKTSKDIIIIGIDARTLDALGRWPFPRSRHAELLNSFTRIQKQNERESAILLDVLFNDISDRAFEDVVLLDAIKQNGRVALQTQLFRSPMNSVREEDFSQRLNTLLENYGELRNIRGDLSQVHSYYGMESPLIPYGEAIAAYGHASYREDWDKVYRKQQLVVRYSRKIGEIQMNALQIGTQFGLEGRGHLGWMDKEGRINAVELPLTDARLDKLLYDLPRKGIPRIQSNGEQEWSIALYEDHFIPAITLSLALEYFHRTLDHVEVHYGSHISISDPMQWNSETGLWETATHLNEIKIPIDEDGNMRINFMGIRSSPVPGGIQTFPVRPYIAYAKNPPGRDSETWPKTKKLDGKILMVGAFTDGMADDEKPTPMGLMYGVEIHANALNTIVMRNFIQQPAPWINSLAMLGLILAFAFLISRMQSIGWSVIIMIVFVFSSFFVVQLVFEYWNWVISWATPILGIISTYFVIVIYRVLTAERDKKAIKNVFGQFISPTVVDTLANSPPELGGEDVDLTVFFSDIREFSGISEKLDAQQLVVLLNDYLTTMTNSLVNDFEGTLDKYIGDAIMAFWGAPRYQEDHAVLACKSAIVQSRLLRELNESQKSKYGENAPLLDIGIGLNSGKCMVGYIGSEGRKNYTVIGDHVNLASRLESVNKTYKTNIIISEDTWERVRHEPFIVRELDVIRVKGRNKPVAVYELLDYSDDITVPAKRKK